jgi:hypothetical protein
VIATLDERGRIATVNDKFCTVYQFSREDWWAPIRACCIPPLPAGPAGRRALQALEGETWTDVISTWRRDGQKSACASPPGRR